MSSRELAVLVFTAATLLRASPSQAQWQFEKDPAKQWKGFLEAKAVQKKEDYYWSQFGLVMALGFDFQAIRSPRKALTEPHSRTLSEQATQLPGSSSDRPGRLSVLAQLGFSHFSGYSVSEYMGGARYWLPVQKRFAPYVQGLVGIEHSFEESAFAFEPGGGVVIPAGRFLVTGGVGFRHAAYEFAGSNSFSVQGGILIPLGPR